MRIARFVCSLLVLAGLALMVQLSLPYIHFKPGIDFLQTKTAVYPITHWRTSFYIHVFTSCFVLAAGLLQFIPHILKRFKKVHRFSGYIYCGGVLLVSGPAGFVMALYANGGLPARISFVLLALLWMVFTGYALREAMKRNWKQHAGWMARSYALTLSALTLRLYALLIGLLNLDIRPAQAYVLIAWLSWTINLAVAELWIKNGGVQSFFRRAGYSQLL